MRAQARKNFEEHVARPLAKCPAGENLARQGDGLSVRRWTLDRRMEATGLASARFMDDWVVLAPTRWALRRAIVIVNETLRELRSQLLPWAERVRGRVV